MSKIVRYEFMGNSFLFWFGCVTIVLIPLALLYLINSTIRIETEVDNAEEFAARFRSSSFTSKLIAAIVSGRAG